MREEQADLKGDWQRERGELVKKIRVVKTNLEGLEGDKIRNNLDTVNMHGWVYKQGGCKKHGKGHPGVGG